jgi:hypothetical protein
VLVPGATRRARPLPGPSVVRSPMAERARRLALSARTPRTMQLQAIERPPLRSRGERSAREQPAVQRARGAAHRGRGQQTDRRLRRAGQAAAAPPACGAWAPWARPRAPASAPLRERPSALRPRAPLSKRLAWRMAQRWAQRPTALEARPWASAREPLRARPSARRKAGPEASASTLAQVPRQEPPRRAAAVRCRQEARPRGPPPALPRAGGPEYRQDDGRQFPLEPPRPPSGGTARCLRPDRLRARRRDQR